MNKIFLVQLFAYLKILQLLLEATLQYLWQTVRGTELILGSVYSWKKEAFSLAIDPLMVMDAKASKTKAVDRAEPRQIEHQQPTYHPSVSSWVKRLIDILGALIGLGITAILFAPIAIAIKLDSPGPILFSQQRCGCLGECFRLWKFRSMVNNAEMLKPQVENQITGPIFKNENDPRITKVGRFLRRTSLDELPQFFNVLKGEMSLVGTRPPTPDEVEQYTEVMWQRLNVRPGITGEWQTNGRSQISNFEQVIQLDLLYQEKWNIMYDIKLILKTLVIIFRKNNGAS